MKKNIRKIPREVFLKLDGIEEKNIVVAYATSYSEDSIKAGCLKHLGIEFTKQGVSIPESIVPDTKQGKFSARNINGREIIRKDLAKETHYRTVMVPNWGDYSKGTHCVDMPYQKYPRDFIQARELDISIHATKPNLEKSVYLIAFRVNEVLDKTSEHFQERLFENLNLLQENIGACDVEPATTSMSDYVKSLHVEWEILPPGIQEEVMLAKIFKGREYSQLEKDVAKNRHDFFESLNYKSIVVGKSGLIRYFGALIEDNLVVFENIEYGNAIYILFNNWEELSKRNRHEICSGQYGTDFTRIIHSPGWEERVKHFVESHRTPQN